MAPEPASVDDPGPTLTAIDRFSMISFALGGSVTGGAPHRLFACVLAASCLASCGRVGFQLQEGALPSPVIVGEDVADHLDLTWSWSTPAGTATFRYAVDAAPLVEVDVATTTASFLAPGDGAYTLRVQACDASGACSLPAEHTTTVALGPALPGPWGGVARTAIATTGLGHLTGIVCGDCASDATGAPLDGASASGVIARALMRGADGVALKVSMAEGTLVVGPDAPTLGSRATLEELFALAALRDADAVVILDLEEGDATPDDFADALLALLDAEPRSIAKSGRPLWLRSPQARSAYRDAILTRASASHPLVAPYLRAHHRFDIAAIADPASFRARVDAEVVGPGLDGVVLDHRSANLFFGIGYARSVGLGVTVESIAPVDGDVVVASLREEVDVLDARYRVDYARTVVEEVNAVLYTNASRQTQRDDAELFRNDARGSVAELRPFDVAPTATSYGSPSLLTEPAGAPLFGDAFAFRGAQMLVAWDEDVPAGRGLLVTAAVFVRAFSDAAILTKAEMGAWVLELTGGGPSFAVGDGSAYARQSYPGTGGRHRVGDMSTDASYFLVGVWLPSGTLRLFINGEPVGPAVSAPAMSLTDVPIAIGADPQSTEATGARLYLDGDIQQAMVADWVGSPSGPGAIND